MYITQRSRLERLGQSKKGEVGEGRGEGSQPVAVNKLFNVLGTLSGNREYIVEEINQLLQLKNSEIDTSSS